MAEVRDLILSGDIGGTSTRLALYRHEAGILKETAHHTYPSRHYAGLEEIVEQFLAGQGGRPRAAGFGVAGPVREGRAATTNLPWVVDARAMAGALGLDTVHLLNDLEAAAHGIAELGEEDFAVLQTGAAGASGNAAVIAAGTGLGEAGLHWDGARHRPFATEGGHADFAARDELEAELLFHLRKRFGRVSWERVLSGPGLVGLYEFLRDTGRGEEAPWQAAELAGGDAAAAISRLGLEGRSELCSRALDLFVSLYGAEAGNLALKMLATGGVYLAGGIAPKIRARLEGPIFRSAFVAKGRFRPLLEAMPVRIILNGETALLGTARVAALAGLPQLPPG